MASSTFLKTKRLLVEEHIMKKIFFGTILLSLLLTGCSSSGGSSGGKEPEVQPNQVNSSTWYDLINSGQAISAFSNVSLTLEHGGYPFFAVDTNIDCKINNGTVFIDWKEYGKFYFIFDESKYNEKTRKYETYSAIVLDISTQEYTKNDEVTGGYLKEIMSGWILPALDLSKLLMADFTYSEESKSYTSSKIFSTSQLPPLPTNDFTHKVSNVEISFLNNQVQDISYRVDTWSQDFKLTFSNYGTTTFDVPDVE